MSFNKCSLFLEGLHNGDAYREIKFVKKMTILGRGAPPGCDIELKSKIMTKKHCTIEFRNNRMYIKDLKSSNGTFVNDTRINQEVELKVGDIIGFGCNPEKLEINKDKPGFLMYKVKEGTIELDSSEDDEPKPSTASPQDDLDELLKEIDGDEMLDAIASKYEDDVIELSDDEIKFNTWKEKLSQSGRRSPVLQAKIEPSEKSHERSKTLPILQISLQTPPSSPSELSDPPSSQAAMNEPPSLPSEMNKPEEDSNVPETVQGALEKNLVVVVEKLTIHSEQLAEYYRLEQESSDDSYLSSASSCEIFNGYERRKTLPSTKEQTRKAEKVRKKIAEIADSDSDSDEASTSNKPQRKRRKRTSSQSPTRGPQLQRQIIPTKFDSSRHNKKRRLQAPLTALDKYKIPKKSTVASTPTAAARKSTCVSPGRMTGSSRDPIEPDVFSKATEMRRRRLSMLRSSIDMPVETAAERESKKKIQDERNEKLRKLAEKQAADKEEQRALEAMQHAPSASHAKVTLQNRGDFLTKLPDKQPIPRRQSISEPPRRSSISEPVRRLSINEAPKLVADISARNGSLSKLWNQPIEVSTEPQNNSGSCNNEDFYNMLEIEPKAPSQVGFYNQIEKLPTAPQPQVVPRVLSAADCVSILKVPAAKGSKSKHSRRVHFKENKNGEIEVLVRLIASRKDIKEMEDLEEKGNETPESSPDYDKKLSLGEDRSRVNDCQPSTSRGLSVESRRSVPAATISTHSTPTLYHSNPPAPPLSIMTTEQECINRILAWKPLVWDMQEQAVVVVHSSLRPTNSIKIKFDRIDEYKYILGPIIEFELKARVVDTFIQNSRHQQSWIKLNVAYVHHKYSDLTELTLTCKPRDPEATLVCKRNYPIGALLVLKSWNDLSARVETFFGYVTRFEKQQRNEEFNVTVQAMIYFQLNSVIETFFIDIIFPYIFPLIALKELKDSEVLQKLMDPTTIETVTEFNDGNVILLGQMTTSQISAVRKVQRLIQDTRRGVSPLLVIEGGPGTGKTRTIAAAVLQIISSNEPCPNILVCAKSHKCLDEIAILLLNRTKWMNINIVRIGQPKKMNGRASAISLHELAQQHRLKMQKGLTTQHLAQSVSNHDSEQFIIHNANIILTTIYSSFELRKSNKTYDICLIDEAASFNDAQLLIPMQLGFKKLVLVGDKSTKIGDSVFGRILDALKQKDQRDPTVKLVEQFRMDPEILQFPNKELLNKALINHALIIHRKTKIKIHPAYKVINIMNAGADIESSNIAEFARAVSKSVRFVSIAVVTTDGKHMAEVNNEVKKKKNVGDPEKIEVFTIDSIQGVQKDIVIIYLPRNQRLGDFATKQRLAVALTRARLALYICGNFETLQLNNLWNHLIEDAKERRLFINLPENSLGNPFNITQGI